MAILPVVREQPSQVTYEIRNKGSFTIPEAARKAHRLLIDLEVVSVTRNQYQNLMYNLPQGDYCNVTYWAGASIMKTRKVKYASERLIDWVNIEAGIAFNVGLAAGSILFSMDNLAVALGLIPVQLDRQAPVVWGYPISHLKFVCPPDTQIRLTCQWYPFPDLPEFEEPDPDLDDPASGEDEYPSPRNNPMNEPWEGNNLPSPIQPGRDLRDFLPPGGSTSGYMTRAVVTYRGYTDPRSNNDSIVLMADLGLFEGVVEASEFSYVCDRQATTEPAGTFCNLWRIVRNGGTVTQIEVSLVDAPVVTVTVLPP